VRQQSCAFKSEAKGGSCRCRTPRRFAHSPAGVGTLGAQSAGDVADFLSLFDIASRLDTFGFILRKMLESCCFAHSICASLRVKCAQFAALKKVMPFVFKYFLASFPLFLYFRALPQPGNIEPCCIPPFQHPVGTCALSKSSNCAFKARISHSIWVRFRFVFQRSFFVFKYFLASFPLFFIFCSSLHSPIAGTLPRSLASWRALTLAYDNVSTK
jgi:hypothetical protein